jgi:hypothetical protein
MIDVVTTETDLAYWSKTSEERRIGQSPITLLNACDRGYGVGTGDVGLMFWYVKGHLLSLYRGTEELIIAHIYIKFV